MNRANNAPDSANPMVNPTIPRPSLSSRRWTSRGTHPRLVSFSWAAITPMATQR